MSKLRFSLDRHGKRSLAEQIRANISDAIRQGHLYEGARLPSWRDLAVQLGVSRGTVKAAYDRLSDDQLVISKGAAGTFVASVLPALPEMTDRTSQLPLPDLYQDLDSAPKPFQVGVPAQDGFPHKLWSRIMLRCSRQAVAETLRYPDPRGEQVLRKEIAAYLAVSRGLQCSPDQVIITNGYAGALGLALHLLRLDSQRVWVEDPCYPLARHALSLAGYTSVPIPVDEQGICVDQGVALAPDAQLAIVTPSQQAPLGMQLSLARRQALLIWARENAGWVIEDDYLSELQLNGRASPALASLDHDGRVIHIGTFSKTISPRLRLGFMVVPPMLASRAGDTAAALSPASALPSQLAVAEFLRDGHYLRHIRRMKRLYTQRRNALLELMEESPCVRKMAGLSLLVNLPDDIDDVHIAVMAQEVGLAPAPLSPWFVTRGNAHKGLLLGVTNLTSQVLEGGYRHLAEQLRW
uniref:MocR-like pyridoxine biosynthesis transcription factor PdxR n=1 Tax=Halomonas sp. TaxID=1486246 RepID=UPI00260D183D|nr:PLP-dependent aminotransferase family protein [Halomonas sp.]